MTRQERALYIAHYRRLCHERGYTIPDDDDGTTWLDRLGDDLQEFFGRAFTLALCVFFFGFLGAVAGAVGIGVWCGIVAGGLGLLAYERRPALGPLGRRIDELGKQLGHAGYDARVASSFTNAVTLIITVGVGICIGALLGLLFDLAPLGALIGGGLVLWEEFKAAAKPEVPFDPETRDAGGVFGTAEAATTMAHLVEAGLSHGDDANGLFVGTWTTESVVIVKQRFRKARSELRRAMHWLRFEGENGGAIIIAPPGTGKGACVFIPTALTDRTHSKLYLDPAAQDAIVCIPALLASGHKVTVYNLSGKFADRLPPPSQCNLMAGKDPNLDETETEFRNTAGIIAPKHTGGNAEHFSAGGQDIVGSIGLHCLEIFGASASWAKAAEWLHQSPPRLNEVFRSMVEKSRFASVRATGARYYCPVDDKGKPQRFLNTALQNVIETAQTETTFLLTGAIAHLFGGKTGGFADMKATLSARFFIVQESPSDGMRKAIHLLLEAAKADLQTPGGFPVLVMADEACAALPEPAAKTFQSLYSLSRKHRIKTVMVAQSLPQAIAWCGGVENFNALKASCGAIVFAGSNDPITSAYIRNEAGKYTIFSPSSKPGAEVGLDGGTSPIGVELFDDNALRAMQRNRGALVFLMGSKRVVPVTWTPYFRIPALAARAAPDPYHHTT